MGGEQERRRPEAEGRREGEWHATARPAPAPEAASLLEFQRQAGNRAVASLQRRPPPPDPPTKQKPKPAPKPVQLGPQGKAVGKQGAIRNDDGAKLRASPNGRVVEHLPSCASVFAQTEVGGGWYFVSTRSGHTGYVAGYLVDTGAPDPGATMRKIRAGDSAFSLANGFYKAHGRDADVRFFVNVLSYVNPRAFYKPDEHDSWKSTIARKDLYAWFPSETFALTLKGKVESGSRWTKAWNWAKGVAEAIENFAVGGAAFAAGLVKGLLSAVGDLLAGLKGAAKAVARVVKSVVQGRLVSDLRALWDAVKHVNAKRIAASWISDFVAKWTAKGLWDRWQFRGWVSGYGIANVAMAIVSGGGALAAKLGAKFGEFASFLVERIPGLEAAVKAVPKLPRKTLIALKTRRMIGRHYPRAGTVVQDPGIKLVGLRGSVGRDPHHAIQRIIERGVKPHTILEAMRNPVVVLQQRGGNRYLYLTTEVAIVVDLRGEMVTAWTKNEYFPIYKRILKEAGAK